MCVTALKLSRWGVTSMFNQGVYPIKPRGRYARPLPDNTLPPRKDKGVAYVGGFFMAVARDDEGNPTKVKGVPRRIVKH